MGRENTKSPISMKTQKSPIPNRKEKIQNHPFQ
jgi:hypothetical protein